MVKAQTERRMTVDELFQLVESNSKTLQEQKISVEFAQKGIEAARAQRLARQNYQVVSDRYLNQLALITDMLDASNIRLNAELQEVDARINIVYAYYKMKYIAGTL